MPPQWAQAGIAKDIPLHDWLATYTFPLESKFSDLDFCTQSLPDLVTTLLANGTTTALYFATGVLPRKPAFCWLGADKGQRGLVGKVVMDNKEENPEMLPRRKHRSRIGGYAKLIQQAGPGIEQDDQTRCLSGRDAPIHSELKNLTKRWWLLAKKYDTHIQSALQRAIGSIITLSMSGCTRMDDEAHEMGLLQDKAVMACCRLSIG